VEPLAWDAAGSLYYLWTEPGSVWLARSMDQGSSWQAWRIAQPTDPSFYPYLVARRKGELAATWFSGLGTTWRAHVARIDVVDRGTPTVAETTIIPDTWGLSSRREPPDRRSAAGEYLPILFLRDGSLAVVSPIQNERAGRFGFTWWRLGARD
jgi:hypothetical protein